MRRIWRLPCGATVQIGEAWDRATKSGLIAAAWWFRREEAMRKRMKLNLRRMRTMIDGQALRVFSLLQKASCRHRLLDQLKDMAQGALHALTHTLPLRPLERC